MEDSANSDAPAGEPGGRSRILEAVERAVVREHVPGAGGCDGPRYGDFSAIGNLKDGVADRRHQFLNAERADQHAGEEERHEAPRVEDFPQILLYQVIRAGTGSLNLVLALSIEVRCAVAKWTLMQRRFVQFDA